MTKTTRNRASEHSVRPIAAFPETQPAPRRKAKAAAHKEYPPGYFTAPFRDGVCWPPFFDYDRAGALTGQRFSGGNAGSASHGGWGKGTLALPNTPKWALEPQKAVAIAKLAAQITESMKAEANIRLDGMLGEKLPLGHMAIGHEQKAIDG